jgi:hypothetical protein
MKDWLIGGTAVLATGAVDMATPATKCTTWSNGSTPYPLAGGGAVGFLGAWVQPTVANTTPGIGHMMIDRIQGHIHVTPNVSGGAVSTLLCAAVGIFFSKLNITTSIWDFRNLLVPADVTRDDFYFLEYKEMLTAGGTTSANQITSDNTLHFDLNVPINTPIGAGEGVMVVVATLASATVSTAFRTLIGPVA